MTTVKNMVIAFLICTASATVWLCSWWFTHKAEPSVAVVDLPPNLITNIQQLSENISVRNAAIARTYDRQNAEMENVIRVLQSPTTTNTTVSMPDHIRAMANNGVICQAIGHVWQYPQYAGNGSAAMVVDCSTTRNCVLCKKTEQKVEVWK